MPVVAQVSDLHLSPRVPERQAQAELVLAGINKAKPDLTVVTGDLTDDGWDRPDDLVWAKQWMDERLDHEWFAVPGNHDVGNFAGAKVGAICGKRIQAWQKTFDDRSTDWFWKTSGSWELVGINSMVYGPDGKVSQLQWERCYGQLRGSDWSSRYLALFLHSPFFVDTLDEQEAESTEYWLGHREARYQVWDDINVTGLGLIASGHVHQTKLDTFDGTHIVWAPPASGTWVHAPGLPNPPAPEKTGFVLHHLGEDGSVRSEVVACAPMLKTVFYDPTGGAG
ncbi:metallophosphoesterase [Phycisphaeraceae bacterium D3-23]